VRHRTTQATAEESTSSVRGARKTFRPRRTLAGELMMTPRKPLRVTEDGRTEVLQPGRSRVARDHEWVRERPELWEPADKQDADTLRFHLVLLERALRHSERDLERLGSKSRRHRGNEPWRLGGRPSRSDRGREPWRLGRKGRES
jgi:hypothetical protein